MLLCCSSLARSCAEDLSSTVSQEYDAEQKLTLVFAHEKLIDATTGLGAGFFFRGHEMHETPKTVSLSLFGYHDDVRWQKIKTVTITYDGKTCTCKAFHTLHGDDRDKTTDLVQSVYFETMVAEMPLETARQIFSSQSVKIQADEADLDLSLSPEQMDRCRDVLNVIKTRATIKAPSIKRGAESETGLPVTRTIDEATGDVTLASATVQISARFGFRCLSFVTVSGQRRR